MDIRNSEALEVAAFYDSDEDIAWGPISLREIKGDFKRPNKVGPNYRRQTIDCGSLDYGWETSSEYATANESVKSEDVHVVPNISTESEESVMDEVIEISSEDEEVEPYHLSVKPEPLETSKYDFNSSNIVSSNGYYSQNCSENPESSPASYCENEDYSILERNEANLNNSLNYSNEGENQFHNSSDTNTDILDDSSESHNFLDDTIERWTRMDLNMNRNMLNNDLDESNKSDVGNMDPVIVSDSSEISHKSRIPTPLRPASSVQSCSTQENQFKVPSITVGHSKKSPFTKPSTSIEKVSPYKSIISPVRLYIKNSPVAVLKQNVKPGSSLFGFSEPPSKFVPRQHKNIVDSFPSVFYRPSKKVVEKSDSNIILPQNIKTLIKDRTVIKHEQRVRVDMDESVLSVSEKLSRNLLSKVDEKNMSVHVATDGLNK